MAFNPTYIDNEPTREAVNQTTGPMLLEFGADWCGHCQALSPSVEDALKTRPQIQHLRIADGRGKPLGRSFRVKLWPTFVLLREGEVIAQLVRPTEDELRRALNEIAPA